MEQFLTDLNEPQRRAVIHGLSSKKSDHRPLLVIAGAGSGKTKTLSCRVAYLIINGVEPAKILLLAFGRLAANEMIGRAKRIIAAVTGRQDLKLPWSGTFHSVGAQLLRRYARHVGLSPSFTILDRSDAADLMDCVRHDLGFSKTKTMFPKKDTCLGIYSYMANSQKPLKKVLSGVYQSCKRWFPELRKLFASYEKAKRRQNVVDYDDLLLFWLTLMEDAKVSADIAELFDHVLVDEYQDTNALQSEILMKLKPDGRGLMVVGDDAQSIYSFRAATVRNIRRFPKQFGTGARIIKLEQNYRATQPILKACNGVIGLAEGGFPKDLWSNCPSNIKPAIISVTDERAQASLVAQQILKAREEGIPLKSQAVLFRTSQHSAQLEIELARRKIPFKKFGGLKLLEAAHVRDVISVLRWRENPADHIAGFRVLQLLPGVGPRRAMNILDELGGLYSQKAMRGVNLPTSAAEGWVSLARMHRRATESKHAWPASIRLVLDWYAPYFQNKYDDLTSRQVDLEQLEQIAGSFNTCQRFLTDISLGPPDPSEGGSQEAQAEEYAVLSTIHSAKGREWRMVRILSVVDGCIPSSRAVTSDAIEEERRLLYVAMTRAKSQLDLFVPRQLFHQYQPNGPGQHHVLLKLTRFIPSSIIGLFDRKVHQPSNRPKTSIGSTTLPRKRPGRRPAASATQSSK
jgi:DNA helicase II / ATP-dependent DNA helicase PcrA